MINIIVYIILGIVAFILLIWIASEIQIKVWIKGIEKFFSSEYNKLKTDKDEKQKEE